MKSISLYEPAETIIHKLSPMTKVIYILACMIIVVAMPYKTVGLICLAISLALLISGQVFKKVIPIIGVSSIVMLTVIIIQSLFNAKNETVLFNIGAIKVYEEGLMMALKKCINILNIICVFSILILSTKPSDLIEDFVRRGLSPRLGYVLSSVLQIIPQMMSTVGTITDAQRARGMETEGKLMTRIKAFFPLIGPVVMNSLINTRERSMALEVRGFSSKTKKTYLNEPIKNRYDKVIQIILIALAILAIVWRIIL